MCCKSLSISITRRHTLIVDDLATAQLSRLLCSITAKVLRTPGPQSWPLRRHRAPLLLSQQKQKVQRRETLAKERHTGGNERGGAQTTGWRANCTVCRLFFLRTWLPLSTLSAALKVVWMCAVVVGTLPLMICARCLLDCEENEVSDEIGTMEWPTTVTCI